MAYEDLKYSFIKMIQLLTEMNKVLGLPENQLQSYKISKKTAEEEIRTRKEALEMLSRKCSRKNGGNCLHCIVNSKDIVFFEACPVEKFFKRIDDEISQFERLLKEEILPCLRIWRINNGT